MSGTSATRADGILIADQFIVETNRKLTPVGGLAAFGVTHRAGRTDLMAIQLDRTVPARPQALQALTSLIEGLLTPVAHGSAGAACYVICLAPPGPSVQSRTRPWSEGELLACVLRPAARVLETLATRGLTHRGIRLDNVFQALPGQPVVLGTAWTAPPAMAQPALFEPPYSAMCLPAGRGDGSIADDVYALGVLLLCLALGRTPLEQLDDASIIQRKLELGTYAALVGQGRVAPMVGDLVRGMLAEDPEHRPTPALLLDPSRARGRRVATRPPRRAQRPMVLAGTNVWDARSFAYALATEPEKGVQSLRGGMAEQWFRRDLGDAQLATPIEELVRQRSLDTRRGGDGHDAELLMRAVALIDPLAPLCWRGIALWPDGIGPALAVAQRDAGETLGRLQELVVRQEVANWAPLRADRCDVTMLQADARRQQSWLRQLGKEAGAALLTYLLNPLMPCASPALASHWVAHLTELMPALNEVAEKVDGRQAAPIDADVSAFIAARLERRLPQELVSPVGGNSDWLAQIRILAQLQSFRSPQPFPALATWLVARAGPVVATWRNRDRRTAIEAQLQPLAAAGYLAAILQVLDDPSARGADAKEAEEAAAAIASLGAELARIANDTRTRSDAATRLGQEIAAGFGLAALATSLVVTALG